MSLSGISGEYRELATRAENLSERLSNDLNNLMSLPGPAKQEPDVPRPVTGESLADDMKLSARRLDAALDRLSVCMDALEDSLGMKQPQCDAGSSL